MPPSCPSWGVTLHLINDLFNIQAPSTNTRLRQKLELVPGTLILHKLNIMAKSRGLGSGVSTLDSVRKYMTTTGHEQEKNQIFVDTNFNSKGY
jgi:hypothetical protein